MGCLAFLAFLALRDAMSHEQCALLVVPRHLRWRHGHKLARHESTLLWVARQHSLCEDDALDAYQRALEIFVWRASSVKQATEVAWLKVVVIRTFVLKLGVLPCAALSLGAWPPNCPARSSGRSRAVKSRDVV
jgi:hypothetical protein